MDNINKSFLGSRTELLFFMKNNRNSFWEMMSQNPDLRQDVSRLLEKEILHQGQINYSSIVEMSSNLDPKQTFHPIKNTLVISSENGLAFSTMAEEYLKEKIKNPFFKLDDTFIKDFLRKRREKIDEEEELIVRKNVIRKNEELKEEEDNYALTDVKKFMQAVYRDILNPSPEKVRENIRKLNHFIHNNPEIIEAIANDALNNRAALLEINEKYDLDKVMENSSPEFKKYHKVIQNNIFKNLESKGIPKDEAIFLANKSANLIMAPSIHFMEMAKKGELEGYLQNLKENNPIYADILRKNGINIDDPTKFLNDMSNPIKGLKILNDVTVECKKRNINPMDVFSIELEYIKSKGHMNQSDIDKYKKDGMDLINDINNGIQKAKDNYVVNSGNTKYKNNSDFNEIKNRLSSAKLSFNIENFNNSKNNINEENKVEELSDIKNKDKGNTI